MIDAIRYLKKRIDTESKICNLQTCDEEVKERKMRHISYMRMAIEALEKQIPKKWEYEEVNDCDTYVCPCCKEYWYLEGMNPTQSEYNYCPNCGQALKWE